MAAMHIPPGSPAFRRLPIHPLSRAPRSGGWRAEAEAFLGGIAAFWAAVHPSAGRSIRMKAGRRILMKMQQVGPASAGLASWRVGGRKRPAYVSPDVRQRSRVDDEAMAAMPFWRRLGFPCDPRRKRAYVKQKQKVSFRFAEMARWRVSGCILQSQLTAAAGVRSLQTKKRVDLFAETHPFSV